MISFTTTTILCFNLADDAQLTKGLEPRLASTLPDGNYAKDAQMATRGGQSSITPRAAVEVKLNIAPAATFGARGRCVTDRESGQLKCFKAKGMPICRL